MSLVFQRKQILVVDDNPEIRRTLARVLEIAHYLVHQAENGIEALEILEHLTPDLILSDINMPGMDGIEFCKAVRQNPRWVAIPFIFLTANDRREDIQTGRKLGVEDYLTKPIDSDDLLAIIHARLLRAAEIQIAQIGRAYLETVNVLANTIEGRDPYTHGHVERVATYACRLAEALAWPSDQLRTLDFGARLHDIGKITIPDHILKKNGPLTEEEWMWMRQHPLAGAKMLREISLLEGVLPYILYHHEKWDGSGYPHGLREKEIPIEGRILAIVDVYDALTTARPYHPPRPQADVVRFLQMNMGKEFDPNLVPVFLKLIENGKASA
jgi:putative two-component system response regulator